MTTPHEARLIEAALILATAEDRINGKSGKVGLTPWHDLDLWTEAMENFMAQVRAYQENIDANKR